jgi:DsbC/DsbD-like thiol-disulfide interchange protein
MVILQLCLAYARGSRKRDLTLFIGLKSRIFCAMRNLMKSLLAACAVAIVGLPDVALSQSVVSTGQSFVSARLLPGIQEADGARLTGLRLTMAPGWKTYWRSPGEAGIPPSFDWSASQNVTDVQVMWPRPQLFETFGMETIGYADQVVLPVRITPLDPDAPIEVALTADIGVCKEICVIERFDLAETVDPGQRPVGHAQIERAVRQIPMPGKQAGLVSMVCRITGAGDKRRLEAALAFDETPQSARVVVEGTETMWVHGTETHMEDDGMVHVAALVSLLSESTWIDRSAVRLTVLADSFAADIQGCTTSAG